MSKWIGAAVGAVKSIGRVASKAGRWFTATTRSASAASRANKILRKVKIGGQGIGPPLPTRWTGMVA
ncbi:hypothetical protein DL990_22085 [Amycolatopsis sp. WAC 01416]|nr:hypothetical protein DL990_22085 [Amycolatopsis sp. WAC 01416]